MRRSLQQLLLLVFAEFLSAMSAKEGISWLGCQMYECCDEPYIKPNFKNMTRELKKRVFGQHIVERIVVPAVQAHFEMQHSKPLVMSFNGRTGTGKNHVAKIIAESIYQKGLNSSHVYSINSIYEFPDKRKLNDYQKILQDKIVAAVQVCERSMFIFDEVDKLPEQLLDSIKPFLDNSIRGINFRDVIFIFLSNTGDEAIASVVLAQRQSTQPREKLKAADFERKIIEEIYNTKGGYRMSDLIKNQLIDHFVPFLPLRRQDVEQCLLVYLRAYELAAAEDAQLVKTILDDLSWFPPSDPTFSSSGCKRLEQKAFIALAEWKDEKYRNTVNGDGDTHDEI